MNEFTIVTTIGRPVDEIFAVIRDVARTPVWTPGLTEGRQTSEGPLEPGATLVYRGTFLGRSYETPAVCTAFSENKQFATRARNAHLRAATAPNDTASSRAESAETRRPAASARAT
jgi:hypothetical protein